MSIRLLLGAPMYHEGDATVYWRLWGLTGRPDRWFFGLSIKYTKETT